MKFYEAKSIYELDDKFFNYFKVGPGYEDYIKGKDFKEILNDAKGKSTSEDEEFAKYYLIVNSRKRLYGVFWKNFIGANATDSIRKARLLQGAFEDFCGIIYLALEKALESFGKGKRGGYSGDVDLKGWQYWFGQYVMGDAKAHNIANMQDPLEQAINPDGMIGPEGETSASLWDKLMGDNASELDFSEFHYNWKDLAADPKLSEPIKGGSTMAEVIAAYFAGDSIADIASNLNVAKNTLRYNIFPAFGELCIKYGIDQGELSDMLHNDPDFLISTLKKAA